MQRFTLTLVEVPISATVQFPSTREYCAEWETPEATPVEHVTISEQDIAAEREPHTPPVKPKPSAVRIWKLWLYTGP